MLRQFGVTLTGTERLNLVQIPHVEVLPANGLGFCAHPHLNTGYR